ncbi:hypothetical protein EDD17DRAFT_1760786 [Pisolithus thermaeus]|nr:hypothetical protein EDD17DRAFT_1760786 [Pisolithus thermaeus]
MGQVLAGWILNMQPLFAPSDHWSPSLCLPTPHLPSRPPPAVVRRPRVPSSLVDQELAALEGGVMLRLDPAPSISGLELWLHAFCPAILVMLGCSLVAILIGIRVILPNRPAGLYLCGRPAEQAKACSACTKAGEPCVPGTGRSKSCVRCQKTKGKCDLNPKAPESEKPVLTATSPRGGEKRKWRKSAHFGEPADDEDLDDTPDVEVVSKPRAPRVQALCQDPLAEVLDRRLGEIVKAIERNTTAVETMSKEVKDLSGVLEESFEILKTATTSLVSRAMNDDDDI